MSAATGIRRTEVAVIGGGIVGLAVAWGLVRAGAKVTLFDEGDVAIRASRGNFGLIWVQGKGDTSPAYARWSRESAALWSEFSKELHETTSVDIQCHQDGGLFICLTQEELDTRAKMLATMRAQAGGDYPYEILDQQALRELVPTIGPEIPGATWGPLDGHVNPLLLLRAVNQAFIDHGGHMVNGQSIGRITPLDQGFQVEVGAENWHTQKVVLAAGLGSKDLAPQVGLSVPVAPQRGQVLVTERVQHFLSYPTGHVRQTGEGTVQCGDSKEDVGFDEGTTLEIMAQIARRAVTTFPCLQNVRLIRAWGALRIMTADGYPIYQQSQQYPGAYAVSCHSGITLCAGHAGPIAQWIAGGDLPEHLEEFHAERPALRQA